MSFDPESPDGINADEILQDIVRRWNAGADPLSATAMQEPYAEDAVFFGGLPHHSVGREQIKVYFDQYDGILSAIRLTLRDMECRAVPPDVLMAQGFADFSFDLPDGRRTFASFRASLVMVRGSDGWKVQLHHFSPPPLVSPVPL